MRSSDPKISAVLIVKNEESVLDKCLQSVKGVDEIIVCDTGSTDSTVEVAKKYTDKVFTDYTWNDNFAEARNHALKKATGDWVISIDADEYLVSLDDIKESIRLAEEQGVISVDVTLEAQDNGQEHDFPRLFKRCDQIWWEAAAHNHISVRGTKLGKSRIIYGFSPAHGLDPNRTMRILEKEVKNPERVRELFYLGREYYYRGWNDKALPVLGTYVQRSGFLSEKADAFLLMARMYWNMKMGEDARDACLQAIKINPNFKEAIMFMSDLVWSHHKPQWVRMAETATNDDVLFVRPS